MKVQVRVGLAAALLLALTLVTGCRPQPSVPTATVPAVEVTEAAATPTPEAPTPVATATQEVASGDASLAPTAAGPAASGDASLEPAASGPAASDSTSLRGPLTLQVAKAGGVLGLGLVFGLLVVPARPSWLPRLRRRR